MVRLYLGLKGLCFSGLVVRQSKGVKGSMVEDDWVVFSC